MLFRILFLCFLLIPLVFETAPVSPADGAPIGATPIDTTGVRPLLDKWEIELGRLDRDFKAALWILYTTGELGELPARDAARMEFLNDPVISDQLSQWAGLIRDPLLNRKIEMLHRAVLEARIDNYGRLYELMDELSEAQTNFRAVFEGRETEDGELGFILRHEKDRERRKGAFLARATVGDKIGGDLAELFASRAKAAAELGYGDYYTLRLALDEIQPEKLREILMMLAEMTRPAFDLFLAKQRAALGVETIEAWDLLYDSSGITAAIESYLSPDSMVVRTWRTYRGLGIDLDTIPITMDLEPREGKSQHAMCVAVSPPEDVRVLANAREGLLSSELMLHEMGHAVHAVSYRQAGHLLQDWPSGSFGEGIGEYFGQLVYTKEWLVAVAGVPESLAVSYLKWRGDRRLFNIRWYLAALEFEERAYQNPDQDLSELYWEMLGRYLMIPEHPEVQVWAQIPHFVTHPVYLQNYILADLFAAQLRFYFMKRFGRLLNHSEIGTILAEEFFAKGASLPGEVLLRHLTGSALDPEPFAGEF
ncbi:MAG: hypothetical protein KJ970_06295 [Candidatus Eisenbacteria bacterium]|uniref:Peptidase M3A/M3B catalytic domain-containing protein n=1 Tax=Eiseniibacteriota bacterium TaxID=2212470 RepID=A0A948W6D1_UNCEI|nr:hypothetical protein [Candidatus Eisenbacteria bacterium]MBU1947327.1 hypothetical protein [Candidatus Eisenbacteria bacterium]MBU2690521.1 hypothetical protein [Candidatus Eisenbacteria bacterium]